MAIYSKYTPLQGPNAQRRHRPGPWTDVRHVSEVFRSGVNVFSNRTRLQLVMLCCQSTSALGKDSGAGFCYRGLAMGQHFSDDFPDRNSPMSERMICL